MPNPITSITKSLTTNAFKLLRHRGGGQSKPTTITTATICHEITTVPIQRTTNKHEQYRQVFRYLDSNDDGNISVDELRSYFSSFGESLSREEAEKLIRALSSSQTENDHKVHNTVLLDFDQFIKMMESRDEQTNTTTTNDEDNENVVLRQAFEVYDDGNGCITPRGLYDVLRRLGDVRSHEECQAMIRVYDLDGNGVLDFHEFCKMMN